MPGKLPSPRYSDNIKKRTQITFGGLDGTYACSDGGICHMHNMSGREYPLATVRAPRYRYTTLENPNGIHMHDGIYAAVGTSFIRVEDESLVTELGTLTDSPKVFASIGSKIVIFPDNKKERNRD